MVLVLHAVVLVLQVWCCVVKHGLVTIVIIMILKDTATFQILCIVSLFCVWNITTVVINSSIHLLKKLNPRSAFVYFRWSWSCYFCLGLKNLALFTSMTKTKTDGTWFRFYDIWPGNGTGLFLQLWSTVLSNVST